MREFQHQFASEEACQDYLAACRWPDGFACPRCGHARAYRIKEHRRWQCAACRYQVSLTAGTILHNTKTPLTVWFWAAYLTVTDTRGMSALLLQRQLGLRRYETAWMLLHKLRRAMVNAAREPLHGEVEIDDTCARRQLLSPVSDNYFCRWVSKECRLPPGSTRLLSSAGWWPWRTSAPERRQARRRQQRFLEHRSMNHAIRS